MRYPGREREPVEPEVWGDPPLASWMLLRLAALQVWNGPDLLVREVSFEAPWEVLVRAWSDTSPT